MILIFIFKSLINTSGFQSIYNQIALDITEKIKNNDFMQIDRTDTFTLHVIDMQNPDIIITTINQSNTIQNVLNYEKTTINDIYNFLQSENQDCILIYTKDEPGNLMCNTKFREDIIIKLNIMSESREGPKFIFRSRIKDYISFIKICSCKNTDWGNPIINVEHSAEFKLGLTVDNNIFYFFNVSYGDIDYLILLENYLSQKYKEVDDFVDFIQNFDIFSLCGDLNFQVSKNMAVEYHKQNKNCSDIFFTDNKIVCTIYEDRLEFENFVYSIGNFLDSNTKFKINNDLLQDCAKLILELNSINPEDLELISITINSLFKNKVIVFTIRKIFNSKLSPVKILFLEFLYTLNFINRDVCNWFLAYDYENFNTVGNLIHNMFVEKYVFIVKNEMENIETTNLSQKLIILLYIQLSDDINLCFTNSSFYNILHSKFIKFCNCIQFEIIKNLVSKKGRFVNISPISILLKVMTDELLLKKDNNQNFLDFLLDTLLCVCKCLTKKENDLLIDNCKLISGKILRNEVELLHKRNK